ncbi:MAG: hypothetical protein M3Z01_07620 [Thermoproteota archaeon]|nr:hypothetical protein [Thermoproteota archaeon]
MKVTDEHVHDSKVLHRLVEDIIKSDSVIVGKLLAEDGTYDGNAVFRCLAVNGILPCIKVKRIARINKKPITLLESYGPYIRVTINSFEEKSTYIFLYYKNSK